MFFYWSKAERSSLTFRDEEAGRVEAGSDSRDGVNHARLVDPLERTFLWVPLHGVEGVPIGCGPPDTSVRKLKLQLKVQKQLFRNANEN